MTHAYRSEIDGLRALAVLPVILFHANLGIASGGFIGVDVFFVISGYLITRIIMGEMREDRFTIARFYERRIRRIMPALMTVLVATSVAMFAIMLPSEFSHYARGLLSALLFASNMYFQRSSGYFDPAAEEQPLLHTWSLAVEEQFYIFYPLFLMLIWRYQRQWLAAWLLVGVAASFAISQWAIDGHGTVNFYYLPTRAWELLAGALCAHIELKRQRLASNQLLALVGLVGLLISLFSFDSSLPWPSTYTILPVASTALIILFGYGTWVAKGLSLKPLQAVGLVSYSAYLWHYPLFVSAHLLYLSADAAVMWGLCALTLLLAALTYRFIEVPFRRQYRYRATLVYMAAALGVMALIGAYAYVAKSDANYAVFEAAMEDKAPSQKYCHWEGSSKLPAHPIDSRCLKSSDQLMFHVLGDSHAPQIGYLLTQMLEPTPYGYYDYTHSGCIPLKGFARQDTKVTRQCHEYAADALSQVASDNAVLLLTSRWSMWVHGESFDNQENGVEYPAPLKMLTPEGEVMDKAQVLATIDAELRALLKKHRVILVYPTPEAGWNVPKYAARQQRIGRYDGNLSTRYDVFLERNKDILALFDGINHPNLYRIKPHELLCDTFIKDRCANIVDGQILYFDDDHLSLTGARLLAPALAEVIEGLKDQDFFGAEPD